jgi:hypothetical protein
MRGLVPVRIAVHKTRKVQLNSHLKDYKTYGMGSTLSDSKEDLKNLFHTPDLNAFYQHRTIAGYGVKA